MAAFTVYNDRLPDPTFGVNSSGAVDPAGSKGPGFSNTTVISNRPVQASRTNSGRGVHRESGSHYWEFGINYHPMRRNEFDTVSSFLDFRNGKLNPFYVVLPQNNKPKDSAFAIFAAANILRFAGAAVAGASHFLMDAAINISGTPLPGDFFTVSDPNDITHEKVYKVTRIETNATYLTANGQPTLAQIRVHTMPPLTKFVADNSIVNWIDPKFRVYQKSDVQEYQLNTDNLYSYQLQVEEIQV